MMHTGIIRSFSADTKQGLITHDLGGDILFFAEHINCNKSPKSGYMVEFQLDDSSIDFKAVDIRFI
ncbi:MAG: hypothetical protein ACRC9O_03695 [Plesiomonas sp.]|uniref:hypothetical protein n=1 Tax=Plesiomonas sp. TaxID=2486279 RepID=UPI003F2E9B92